MAISALSTLQRFSNSFSFKLLQKRKAAKEPEDHAASRCKGEVKEKNKQSNHFQFHDHKHEVVCNRFFSVFSVLENRALWRAPCTSWTFLPSPSCDFKHDQGLQRGLRTSQTAAAPLGQPLLGLFS